jgi:hypothetical protein
MELGIPLIALASLYVVSNQSNTSQKKESFVSNSGLPNTNIPNRNYPEEYPVLSADTDLTSKLSTVNKFDTPSVYTDKYFNKDGPIVGTVQPNSSSQYYSLTGNKVDSSYFQHNNMVPFFGSNIRSRHVEENSNESVLDNMVGSGSQINSKKEQSPMFAPGENLQWAYGAPSNTDFYQSRVNVGSKMSNVKPFAEERVAPGLGLGYTTQGSGGFNSGMAMRDQWLDKSVDQLRVENKPKASGFMMLGHEGPAMSHVTNLGIMGKMEKNRVDTTYDLGSDRWFTTTGAEKGQTLQPMQVERFVNRSETTTDYTGGAGYSNSSAYVTGEYMPSTNIDLGAVPIGVADAGGRNYATDADYGMKSKFAYPNNRSANRQDGYFGAVGGALNAAVAPLLDIMRPSRKENTIGNLRPYQNAKTAVTQSYIFNPADRPAATIRETTENSKFHMNVNANQLGGGYKVTQHQPIKNNRETTDDFYYSGNAGAGERNRQPRTYNAEYNQRNNEVKSSTIAGRMVQGNMSLMNGNINMRQASRDNSLVNNRSIAPTMPYQSPDVTSMGKLQGNTGSNLYSNIQLDRNSPEILSSLKSNPYAMNVASKL